MKSYQPRTRLYVDVPTLAPALPVALPKAQAHYLRTVLRAEIGMALDVFNGRDGAFAATLTVLGKSAAQLTLGDQVTAQETLPKVALAFALLKKERTHMVVEKATELGCARLIPMITDRTQGQSVKQWKADKAMAHAIEACEQCGRTALPEITPPEPLSNILQQPGNHLFADEMRAGPPPTWPHTHDWTTLLIGPEGGWSPEERALLADKATAISLGPRILRAETAAVTALALWQARFDWQQT